MILQSQWAQAALALDTTSVQRLAEAKWCVFSHYISIKKIGKGGKITRSGHMCKKLTAVDFVAHNTMNLFLNLFRKCNFPTKFHKRKINRTFLIREHYWAFIHDGNKIVTQVLQAQIEVDLLSLVGSHHRINRVKQFVEKLELSLTE